MPKREPAKLRLTLRDRGIGLKELGYLHMAWQIGKLAHDTDMDAFERVHDVKLTPKQYEAARLHYERLLEKLAGRVQDYLKRTDEKRV